MSNFISSTTAKGIMEVSFDDFPLYYCRACSRPFPGGAKKDTDGARYALYGKAGATCPQCVNILVKMGWSFDYLQRVYRVARTIQRLFPD